MLAGGFVSRMSGGGSGQNQKMCLFCLGVADQNLDKVAGNPELKSYFRQFLWKYLIGDDQVKINEFTTGHLRNNVPPMCTLCHDKCIQLATFHMEFEKVQDEIMEVAQDLLNGWKERDHLFTKGEYDTAVSAIKDRGRSRAPNRFIKSSPINQSAVVFPKYETVQMYQILRNPGHVRIPLSCLKSFGFKELKNLITKNSSVANQISRSVPSPAPSVSLAAKMAAASAAASSKVSNNKAPKRYWINDVQVEMLGSGENDGGEEEEEEVEEYEEEYVDVKPPNNNRQINYTITALPPPKRQKIIITKKEEVILNQPDEEEYYEDDTQENTMNYLEVGQNYEGDEIEEEEHDYKFIEDSGEADDSQFYDDENGDVYEDDGDGPSGEFYDEEDYEGDDPNGADVSEYYTSKYYIGHPDQSDFPALGGPNQKKRKRVFVLRKGNWTADEDEMISTIVGQTGPKNWSKVALQLGTGRTGKQIRERWTHHLNPEVNKEPWSEEEDLVLMRAHATWGNQWSRISKLLPGRTDNAVKNHWNGTLKRKAQGLN